MPETLTEVSKAPNHALYSKWFNNSFGLDKQSLLEFLICVRGSFSELHSITDFLFFLPDLVFFLKQSLNSKKMEFTFLLDFNLFPVSLTRHLLNIITRVG